MYQITKLNSRPKQQITISLTDGTSLELYFEYKPNQLGWFFNFTYNGEEYKNIRLTTSYNILRAYRNWLSFGLRCDTTDTFEPTDIDDFTNGYATLYILTKDELEQIEALYYAKDV